MFILVPHFAIEMNWTNVLVGFSFLVLILSGIVAILDKDDEDEMKEGFADYVAPPEAPEAELPEAQPPKRMTRYQTAEMTLNKDPFTSFHTMGYAPIIPLHLEETLKKHFVSILTPTGTKITWDMDGSVIVDDEVKKLIFWPCPKLSDAVFHKDWNGKPTSFKFNSDGSVVAKAYGFSYYFGPEVEGEPEVGEELEDGHFCANDDNWLYGYKDCCCLEEEQYNTECHCRDCEYERNYYDSEDEMFPRCDDCSARHHPTEHNCRT